MDSVLYSSNVITKPVASSYPSPSEISPQHLQSSSLPPHTLPPLQSHSSAMQPLYGSHPHTPRTPATPNTPGSATNHPNYPPPNQSAGRGAAYAMSAYGSQPNFATSSAMMSQSTVAPSHQPIAPAPSGRVPPVLRPMPAGGVMPPTGSSSPYGTAPLMPQAPMQMQDGDAPTHVVGSQGRRGILPSAPGRPTAPMAGTGGAKASVTPVKNEEGKFPCPHCTKTYLHAKHLKRHLLRHTGDRPYMCVLCRDTFSRSDILKRHFQKCSIRRGNPTGASHLSHPQAHVKKNAAGQKPGGEGDLSHLNGMSNLADNGMVHPFGMVPVSDGMGNLANDQSQLSRSSSLTRLENNNQDRRSMTGSVMGASSRGGSYEQSYGGEVPQQMSSYPMPPGQNGMPMYGGSNPNQQSGMEWAQMFQHGAQNPYGSTFPPNIGQTQIAIKAEPDNDAEGTDGYSGVPPDDSVFIATWGLPPSQHDPYTGLSNQILDFFYPPGAMITSQSAGMNLYFSPENVKDFLSKYTHFHVHFPFLHTPSFHVSEAYTGLLAGMCCIGACYSDRVSASHVREMMDFLCAALERDTHLSPMNPTQQHDSEHPHSGKRAIEELQALLLMQVLNIWNGTPQQREHARQMHPILGNQGRLLGLLEVSKASPIYSPLHQPDFSPQNFDVSTFNWEIWVEQEKRVRLMHLIYLFDCALALYFNMPMQFDAFEIRIPLPSDDASWDARTAEICAKALGLYGSEAARQVNSDGTQRSKQPEMNLVLQTLLHPSYQIQPGSTNLYGKFILIHAIVGMIIRAQINETSTSMTGYGTPPQSDWMVRKGGDVSSANNSGRATPVEGSAQGLPPHAMKTFLTALDKFKQNWDMDMTTQFPPTSPSSRNPRRYGFGRDGIHFYWLAMYLLKLARPAEFQTAPDYRFQQVIHMLKMAKGLVTSDSVTRGEELGSVGDIDAGYGASEDLTLNMTDLFKPLPKVVEDPGTTSVKTDI